MSTRAKLLAQIVEMGSRALRQEVEGPEESAEGNMRKVIALAFKLAVHEKLG